MKEDCKLPDTCVITYVLIQVCDRKPNGGLQSGLPQLSALLTLSGVEVVSNDLHRSIEKKRGMNTACILGLPKEFRNERRCLASAHEVSRWAFS
jgi:hypothetical protein